MTPVPHEDDDQYGDQHRDQFTDQYDDQYDQDEYEDEYDEDGRPILYDDDGPRASRRPLVIGVAALVVVAVAVVLFITSRDDDEPEASFSLAVAAANADRAERVAYDVSVQLDGRTVTAGHGVLDTVTGSQQMTPVIVAGSDSAASADAADAAASGFVVDAAEQAVYVAASSLASIGLSFDRPYVRIDVAHLGDGVHLDVPALVGRYGGDPLAVIQLLGRTAAQDLGTETIEGELVVAPGTDETDETDETKVTGASGESAPTDTADGDERVEHFRVEVTVDALLEANPDLRTLLHLGDTGVADTDATAVSTTSAPRTEASTDASTGASDQASTDASIDGSTPVTLGSSASGDEPTVVVDVFVTEDNIVRRLVFTTSVSGAAIATITFGAYDGDTQVQFPASNQVIDLADAFGR